MKKLTVLVAVIGLMVLAFPAERSIEVQGAAATLGGIFQEPAITTTSDSITVEGAQATWSGTLGNRRSDHQRCPGSSVSLH